MTFSADLALACPELILAGRRHGAAGAGAPSRRSRPALVVAGAASLVLLARRRGRGHRGRSARPSPAA